MFLVLTDVVMKLHLHPQTSQENGSIFEASEYLIDATTGDARQSRSNQYVRHFSNHRGELLSFSLCCQYAKHNVLFTEHWKFRGLYFARMNTSEMRTKPRSQALRWTSSLTFARILSRKKHSGPSYIVEKTLCLEKEERFYSHSCQRSYGNYR